MAQSHPERTHIATVMSALPKRSGQPGMDLLYTHMSPQHNLTSGIEASIDQHIFIHQPLSCTSLTPPMDLGLNYLNCFMGLKPCKLCAAETISSKSTVLRISCPQTGQKHNPALKETLLGLTDISLETILFDWMFIHTFFKSIYLSL